MNKLSVLLASAALIMASGVASAGMTCGRNSACIDYDSIERQGAVVGAKAIVKLLTGEVLPVMFTVDCSTGETLAIGNTGKTHREFSNADVDFPSGWREKMCQGEIR